MNRFSYTARDQTGKKVKGKVEAQDINQAARLVRERGLVVVSISAQRQTIAALWNKVAHRVSLDDLSVFTRQFTTMITSGLPITDALLIIKSQSRPGLSNVVSRVLSDVEGGSSLAAAFEKHPKVFSPVYVALIRAGEEGGVLDKILSRLADNLESQREFRAKVKGALIYPVVVIVGMLVVAVIMMLFVIPRLTALYQDLQADLPVATRILIGISDFVQSFWWLLVIIIIGLIWGFAQFAKTPGGRGKIDEWKLRIPITGKLQRQVILAEMSRTLGLLVGAGISIIEGLNIVSGVVNNVVVGRALDRASNQVEKGYALAHALSKEPDVFPPMLFQMLAVGEETGKLDEALIKVANIFEQESEQTVKGLTAAIEPLIMVVLGIGVGFLVISIILPIYNLTSQF